MDAMVSGLASDLKVGRPAAYLGSIEATTILTRGEDVGRPKTVGRLCSPNSALHALADLQGGVPE